MNRERARELLPIIQAFADGRELQFRRTPKNCREAEIWSNDAALTPNYDFHDDYEYRIQAFAEGKDIQYKTELSNGWNKASYPIFSDEREYRIKPEPREFWLFASGEWQEAYSKDSPLHNTIKCVEAIE